MAASQYELLKCENCGKTLGYIHVSPKMRLSDFLPARYWLHVTPTSQFEKTALCEPCFKQRLEEVLKGKPEAESEKNKSVESRAKSKDRPLVR